MNAKKILFALAAADLCVFQILATPEDIRQNIENNKQPEQEKVNIIMEDIHSNPVSDDIHVSLLFVKNQCSDSSEIRISIAVLNNADKEIKIKNLFENLLFYGYSCSNKSLKLMENFSKKINTVQTGRNDIYPFEIEGIKLSSRSSVVAVGNIEKMNSVSIRPDEKLIVDLSFSRLYKDGDMKLPLNFTDGVYDFF